MRQKHSSSQPEQTVVRRSKQTLFKIFEDSATFLGTIVAFCLVTDQLVLKLTTHTGDWPHYLFLFTMEIFFVLIGIALTRQMFQHIFSHTPRESGASREEEVLSILHMLQDGSRVAREQVIMAVRYDPSLFHVVISILKSNDPLIRQHSASIVENISRKYPQLLSSYKELLLQRAMDCKEQETCISLLRILPRLPLDEQERVQLFADLQPFLASESDMLKVVALQALLAYAENTLALHPHVVALLEEQAIVGIPANQSLARYHLTHFNISDPAYQQRKRGPLSRHWQRSVQMRNFTRQYRKVAENSFYRE